jgi:hypothetical protein
MPAIRRGNSRYGSYQYPALRAFIFGIRFCVAEGVAMVIHRLLEKHAFSPEEVANLVAAYEGVCEILHLDVDRYAPANELAAQKVIEVAQTGVREPTDIVKHVVAVVHSSPS